MGIPDFLIDYSDTIGPLIPLTICLAKEMKLPEEVKVLFWYLITIAVINGISNIMADRSINNMLLYHISAVTTFCILSVFFIVLFRKDEHFRRIAILIAAAFVLFSVANALFWQNLRSFDSNGFGLASVIFIIYSIVFYYQRMKNASSLFIEKQPDFWIVNGIFFYYTGNFFLFIIYNNIIQKKFLDAFFLPLGYWTLHQVMFTIQIICFSIGILLCRPRKQILAD